MFSGKDNTPERSWPPWVTAVGLAAVRSYSGLAERRGSTMIFPVLPGRKVFNSLIVSNKFEPELKIYVQPKKLLFCILTDAHFGESHSRIAEMVLPDSGWQTKILFLMSALVGRSTL